ncbi:TPA: OmpA family protein [Vibrio parahaemolyticus]|uniref:Flagellar protein MotY n=6 Tax=Vibrio parahaemolyticus TaxID=670 RepID=A0AAW3IU40_VIBPH|nr:OmpA family protein [Vibrio parahaemolyticus]APC90408.1 sodium-type flagellar protein MotY precursor [Vibrio parahaemolyticus]EGQ9164131.1 OmpA family protein [Vibrio parahaemolyticus]EGQ9190734.1 OmpA family protein [Vibrio parahaemolyticus]EGQ9350429.1 OmpA family protein [Vibrio parahaemolyticus]EGQ9514572.1 OmpA family protein [Vibrio parahaemolyticus]
MISYASYRASVAYLIKLLKSWKCKIYFSFRSLIIICNVFFFFGLVNFNPALSGEVLTVPMDISSWSFSGNKFECNLVHSKVSMGKFYFRSEPNNKISFISDIRGEGKEWQGATLISQNAPWGKELYRKVESSLTVTKPSRRFVFSKGAPSLMKAIAGGSWITLVLEGKDASALSEVRIPTIQIQKALGEFNACRERLPKLSFSQARDIVLPFQFGQKTLNANQQQTLAALYSYLSVDDRVTKVLIDGHTDNVGPRLTNLSVSRLRAQQVADALIAHGVNPNIIEVRSHGDRYPVANNNTAAGQAKNRRVTLRLVRDNERTIEKNTMYVQQQTQQKKVKVQ